MNGIIIKNREFDAFTGNLPRGWEKFLAQYPQVAEMVHKKIERIMAGNLSSEDSESELPRIELDISRMDRRGLEWKAYRTPIVPSEYVPWGLTIQQERLLAKIFQWLSNPSDPFINEPDAPKKPKRPRCLDLKKCSIPQVDESLLLRFGSEKRRLIMRHPR